MKDFRGINPEIVAKLADHSIKKTDQMLADGRTPIQRAIFAKEVGIPEEVVLELIKLSDLARLPGDERHSPQALL